MNLKTIFGGVLLMAGGFLILYGIFTPNTIQMLTMGSREILIISGVVIFFFGLGLKFVGEYRPVTMS